MHGPMGPCTCNGVTVVHLCLLHGCMARAPAMAPLPHAWPMHPQWHTVHLCLMHGCMARAHAMAPLPHAWPMHPQWHTVHLCLMHGCMARAHAMAPWSHACPMHPQWHTVHLCLMHGPCTRNDVSVHHCLMHGPCTRAPAMASQSTSSSALPPKRRMKRASKYGLFFSSSSSSACVSHHMHEGRDCVPPWLCTRAQTLDRQPHRPLPNRRRLRLPHFGCSRAVRGRSAPHPHPRFRCSTPRHLRVAVAVPCLALGREKPCLALRLSFLTSIDPHRSLSQTQFFGDRPSCPL